MNITSTPYKRGDSREDGKIFWGYLTDKKSGKATREWWVFPEDVPGTYCTQLKAAARMRAKLQKVPFDLTTDYLISILPEDMCCPIMGHKMHFYGTTINNRPSLDKVVPSKGYIPGNVAWISLEANRIKDNATLPIMKKLVAYMEGYQNGRNGS